MLFLKFIEKLTAETVANKSRDTDNFQFEKDILIVYTISEIYNSFLPKAILGQKSLPSLIPSSLPIPMT